MEPPRNRRALVYEKLLPGDGIARQLDALGISASLPFGVESCLRREHPISEEQMIDLASGHVAIIGASCAKITRHVMESLPDLRVISKLGIGYDVIDVDAATDLGIAVTNTPSLIEIDSVAEHAVALMLAAAKRLDFYTSDRIARGEWLDQNTRANMLSGKTVGLIGYGRIARSVAERLHGWGVTIVASDLPGRQIDMQPGVSLVTFDELLAVADVVSLHLAALAKSPTIIGRAQLEQMKPTAILVNTSRGSNIDQDALYEALSSDRLLVAALDVFDPEPPVAGDRLLLLPNVIATPHLGAATPESETDMERMAADNVADVIEGRLPAPLVNPAVLHSPALRDASDNRCPQSRLT